MLAKQLLGRLLTTSVRTCQNMTAKRFASTSMFQNTERFMLDKALLNYTRKYQ